MRILICSHKAKELHFFFLDALSGLCSQFEEKFEEANASEPPNSLPISTSTGSNENVITEAFNTQSTNEESEPQPSSLYHSMALDANVSQDYVGGIMKIVPSDVDVSFCCSIFFLLPVYPI